MKDRDKSWTVTCPARKFLGRRRQVGWIDDREVLIPKGQNIGLLDGWQNQCE